MLQMKKGNVALAALLAFGSAVLAASVVLVAVPQMRSGTTADALERAQAVQEEVRQRIAQYTAEDALADSLAEESLAHTQEIVDQARETAGLSF